MVIAIPTPFNYADNLEFMASSVKKIFDTVISFGYTEK
jgi:hypothetical protein